MQFTKMHGIGNDYVYINGFKESVQDPATLAKQIADRHFGVGGDGLILVLPPTPEDGADADVRMRMFNADGSEAEMCGNGIRCVCKLAHDHGITPANPMRVQTGNGVLSLQYTLDNEGKVASVSVDMGEPVIDPRGVPVDPTALLPTNQPQTFGIPTPAPGSTPVSNPGPAPAATAGVTATFVSMGNPHAVIYVDDLDAVDLHQAGPAYEHHPAFPRRMNIHFVRVDGPGEVTVVHWERGSGPTLACGTGACAVCVAGVLAGRTERTLTTHLPGGDLELTWADNNHVVMTGPATEVFAGDWPG